MNRIRLAVIAVTIQIAIAATLPPTTSLEALNYNRRWWQSRDGLPEDFVQAIAQTPDGYLWIGTSGGLVRFDGISFTPVALTSQNKSRDDSVYSLAAARDGSLWIGMEGGGLAQYRRGELRWFGRDEGLTNGFVRAIFEDHEGRLWAGTDRGLFRKAGDRMERVDGKNDLPAISVHAICQDRKGRMLIGGGGLLVLEPGKKALYYSSSASRADNNVRVIYEDREGTVWIGTISGLRKITGGLDADPFDVPKLIEGVNISALYPAADGVWIGTYGQGLVRYENNHLVRIAAPNGLPHDNVLSLFADREKNFWVGTQGGMQRMNPSVAHTIPTTDGELFAINTVYQDPSGPLMVTSLNGRVYQVRGRNIVPLDLFASNAPLPLRNAFRARDGSLWLGTDGHGVMQIKGTSRRRFATSNGLVNDFVRAFCEDREGSLWIGTDGGVSRWRDGQFNSFQAENGLAYGSVRVLMEDRQGTMWIATDAGISRFAQGNFLPAGPFQGIRGHKVWSLFEDADGGIWLGTHGAGLYLFKSGRLMSLTGASGLPGKIHFITEDRNGDLWLSSPAGICSVARKDLERVAADGSGSVAVRMYTTSDGLTTNQMSGGVQPSGALLPDGSLWFPSARGLVMLTLGTRRESTAPQVLIERAVADDRDMPIGDSLVGDSSALEIPPGRGKLELHYTAIRLRSPERLRFRYWMENAEAGWSEVADRRVAYFSRLPSGRYRFHVAAYDVDDPQRATERVVSVLLRPPFYRTWWFLGLAGLSALALAWTAYRIHVGNVAARFAAVLEERNRVAREMHDTVIQGCVGVSALLEAASSTKETAPELTAVMIERARTEIRATVEDARAAVLNLRQTLQGGVPDAIEKLAARFSRESGLPVQFHRSGTPRSLGAEAEHGLLLAVREALSNAVRHASAHRIDVTLSFSSRWLEVRVEDDGCGFNIAGGGLDKADKAEHYGLIGMKERIEKLGGRFELQSSPGKGTRVLFTVPSSAARPDPA